MKTMVAVKIGKSCQRQIVIKTGRRIKETFQKNGKKWKHWFVVQIEKIIKKEKNPTMARIWWGEEKDVESWRKQTYPKMTDIFKIKKPS